MSTLRLERVVKHFGSHQVVDGVSLDVGDGEIVALLGPSGSGKTTLLRLIAGFEQPDSGRILIDEADVTRVSALERRCGMVFQHYALFPHLTVGENVAYGLERERLSREDQTARVAEALAMVDLAGTEARAVTSLSGGQQQRVALARALAPRPKLLLLDEPLSNLDPSLRERTRSELRTLIRRVGITTLLVTHEQEEAFDLADRIAILHSGHLEQVGDPVSLYDRPATAFVAGFVGRATSLQGTLARNAHGDVGISAIGTFWPMNLEGTVGDSVTMLARPEALRFAFGAPLVGRVVSRRFAGSVTYYEVALADGTIVEVSGRVGDAEVGAQVSLESTGLGISAFVERAR